MSMLLNMETAKMHEDVVYQCSLRRIPIFYVITESELMGCLATPTTQTASQTRAEPSDFNLEAQD